MSFIDCLTPAALDAIEQDVPAWLLPATIANHATLLSGCRLDADAFTSGF